MKGSVKLQCSTAYKQIAEAVLSRKKITTPCDHRIINLAKLNNLLLAIGPYQDDLSNLKSPWEGHLALLKQYEQETYYIVKEVMPCFNEAGLPLMTIKSFLPFPYVDSNLDLLSGLPDHIPDYISLLTQLGYKRSRNLADLREPMKMMYKKVDVRLCLHLHSAVSWNGIIYLPFEQVWKRRYLLKIKGGKVWIPSAEDELLIMAAHALFENKMVSLHEVLYWYSLVTAGLDWSYIMGIAKRYSWYQGMLHFMAIMNQLVELLDLSVKLPFSIPASSLSAPIYFPYIFPISLNLKITCHKFFTDISKGIVRDIPRSLFSYILVDHFWMYRKAFRKKREVISACS